MKCKKTLSELIATVMNEMESAQFSKETLRQYRDVYRRLQDIADINQVVHYSEQLGRQFIEDCNYVGTNRYNRHRHYFHRRCIHLLETMIISGRVEWARCLNKADNRSFSIPLFQTVHADYIRLLNSEGMSQSTICTYGRTAFYFLKHLEIKGYRSLKEMCSGDVGDFLVSMCKEHWNPQCLSSYISGLKRLLGMSDESSAFITELPVRIPRKIEIIEVYSDEENERFFAYLEEGDISIRNKAICLLSAETGLRAIDITNLKIEDVDWKNKVIHFVQVKTGHAINIPLRASYGNAMYGYLLHGRPISNSPYFFLQAKAPFDQINSHTCIYYILRNAVSKSGIEKPDCINGTRMMRHNAASRMVRKGVSLAAISGVLGHADLNSTMTYISTDDAKLSECTLSLPVRRQP